MTPALENLTFHIKYFLSSADSILFHPPKGSLTTILSTTMAILDYLFHNLTFLFGTHQSPTIVEKSALELLAPELQLRILLSAETPEDLHALIQAIPRLYQVFLLNRDTVLSAVARRQFHPAVISEALFFAKISQLQQPLPRDTVLELCRDYLSELYDGAIIPVPMSVALCKLARNVRFFIEDYTRNTLPLMEDLGRSLDVDVLPEYSPKNHVSYSQLSDSETGRLQRAFCRFEIYRYLFARCSQEYDHDIQECGQEPTLTPAEQASLFLLKFPEFQITEINCIRDYLYRRLRGIFTRLEDNAVDTLSPGTFEYDPEADVESLEWSSGIWFFCNSGKHEQDQHQEHLMSLGLPYIRRIFESTGEEQKDLFIRHIDSAVINHLEGNFITSALGSLGFNPAGKGIPLLAETDPSFVYQVNPDVQLDVPDAWQWAHPRGPPLEFSDIFTKGLRDWGYVFWDLDRLRESGILEQR